MLWEIGLAPLGVIKERFALLAEESCEFDVQISHGQTQTHTHTQVPILTSYNRASTSSSSSCRSVPSTPETNMIIIWSADGLNE